MAATSGQFWTQQFLKANGTPYAGVRVFHYVAGNTTTNLNVYQDAAMASPHNNPVDGDASGRVSFYGSGTYRLLVKSSTADGNLTLYDWDPVELVHHTATVRAEDKALSLPAATSAARGRLFGVVDAGGDVQSIWLQRTAAAWQEILTLPTLSQMIQFEKGTDIASTANVTIPTDGNLFDVTGNNNIESFSSFTGYPVIYTRFIGAPLLVNSSTFMQPQNANYQTIAGELIAWMHVGAGIWMWLSSNRSPTVGTLTSGFGLLADGTGRLLTRNTTPVGTIVPYAGASEPTHWHFCNGGLLVRTTTPKLFTAIGTVYGAGDGSTTYAKPDLRGRTIIMLDGAANRITSASTNGVNADTLGGIGGAETHTLVVSQVPGLTFVVSDQAGGATSADLRVTNRGPITDSNPANVRTITTSGGGSAHSNTQPWMALNYIIFAGE